MFQPCQMQREIAYEVFTLVRLHIVAQAAARYGRHKTALRAAKSALLDLQQRLEDAEAGDQELIDDSRADVQGMFRGLIRQECRAKSLAVVKQLTGDMQTWELASLTGAVDMCVGARKVLDQVVQRWQEVLKIQLQPDERIVDTLGVLDQLVKVAKAYAADAPSRAEDALAEHSLVTIAGVTRSSAAERVHVDLPGLLTATPHDPQRGDTYHCAGESTAIWEGSAYTTTVDM